MKRLLYSAILILCIVTAHTQDAIPAAIAVPAGSTLIMHVYAKGTQVYRYTPDPKDTTHYVWTFQEPKANLFEAAAYKKKNGKNFLSSTKSPTWELSDGSMISGAKLQQVSSPDSLSIPWLLLR